MDENFTKTLKIITWNIIKITRTRNNIESHKISLEERLVYSWWQEAWTNKVWDYLSLLVSFAMAKAEQSLTKPMCTCWVWGKWGLLLFLSYVSNMSAQPSVNFFFLRSPFYTTDSVTVRSNSLSSQTMYETKLRLRIVDSLLPHGTFFIRTYKNPSWFMLLSTGIQHRTHIAYF